MEKRRCKPFLTRCPLRGRNCCRPLNAGHISSSDTLHDEEPVVRSSAYFYKPFLGRPIEGDWPYVWLDATYLKVRRGGRIVSAAAVIAIGVNGDGRREVL